MGVKDSNDISSEATHQICSLKFMYTPGEGISNKVFKRILKFEILDFWQIVLFFFGAV